MHAWAEPHEIFQLKERNGGIFWPGLNYELLALNYTNRMHTDNHLSEAANLYKIF